MRLASCLLLFCLLLATLLTGCAAPLTKTEVPAAPVNTPTPRPTRVEAPDTLWPTKGWQTAAPESQGVDSKQLDKMHTLIQEKIDLHSMLVIRHGYIVFEEYYGSYKEDTAHIQYSVTKSFVSTLLGIALDQGKLSSVNQRVLDFFPGQIFAKVDERKRSMRLEDMMMMASGLNCSDDADINRLYRSDDWIKGMLDLPMAAKPGSTFKYCSGVTHVLSAVLTNATGEKTDAYAKKNLFEPLGITNYRWEADRQGIPIGGWGLEITPRDMAKLGYLYLHEGRWEGQQIVSSSWVQTATMKHISTDGKLGYGYQWWTYPTHNAYTALGREGQTIFVAPDLDLIVVTTARLPEGHDPIFDLIDNYILPAVSE